MSDADLWLRPMDSFSQAVTSARSIFQGLLSICAYVLGYVLLWTIDLKNYSPWLQTYLTLTLTLEPAVFLLLSCSGTTIFAIFGHGALSHALSVLSVLKQLLLGLICLAISFVGAILLASLLHDFGSLSLEARFVLAFVALSWTTGLFSTVNYIPGAAALLRNSLKAHKLENSAQLESSAYYDAYTRNLDYMNQKFSFENFNNPLKENFFFR